MRFRYSDWDGTQEINPLDADEVLDLIASDLLEESDLRRALDRLMMNGARRQDGDRLQGLRDLLERLRQKRQEQLDHHNLESPVGRIAERLDEIVEQERAGLDRRLEEAASQDASQDMRDLMRKLIDRKRDALDALPSRPGGKLQQLMDYEFMDEGAREAFQELVDELRQQMLGSQFDGLKQNLERLTPEDLTPVREMMRELNQLLNKRLQGQDTEQDFRDFMDRFGGMFPHGIDDLDDLIDHMQQQAAQMQSLLKSMSEEQRGQLQDIMDALLRDDRLSWDIAQMAGLIEAITGQPLGRPFPFDGDAPLDFGEAMDLMRQMAGYDELERQLVKAMREIRRRRHRRGPGARTSWGRKPRQCSKSCGGSCDLLRRGRLPQGRRRRPGPDPEGDPAHRRARPA